MTMYIDPEMDLPTSPDAYTATSDTMLSVPAPGVLGNEVTDFPGYGFLRFDVILIEEPGHGSLCLERDGSFTYTPDPGFTGTDSFHYGVQYYDGCDVFTRGYTQVTITVCNSAPPVPEFPGHVLVVPGIILGLFGIAVRMRGRR